MWDVRKIAITAQMLSLISVCMSGVLYSSETEIILPSPNLINEILPGEVLSSCLLLAASGDNGTALRDLRSVCKLWHYLTNEEHVKKDFTRVAQTYYIDLSRYTRAEAELKLAEDLARKPRICHLTIKGKVARIEDNFQPGDIFPRLFLKHGPLQSLKIDGNYTIDAFAPSDLGPLGIFSGLGLIEKLKKLEFLFIRGNSKNEEHFCRVVIPLLIYLEELTIGGNTDTMRYYYLAANFLNSQPNTKKIELNCKEIIFTEDDTCQRLRDISRLKLSIKTTHRFEKTNGVWKANYPADDPDANGLRLLINPRKLLVATTL